MALIRQLEERHMQRNKVHSEVEATFTIFTDQHGEKYLQIDTYGSPDRAIPGKVSQSIQFNPESMQQLHAIINRVFGDSAGL